CPLSSPFACTALQKFVATNLGTDGQSGLDAPLAELQFRRFVPLTRGRRGLQNWKREILRGLRAAVRSRRCQSEQRTKAIPPQPHGFVAKVDAALEQIGWLPPSQTASQCAKKWCSQPLSREDGNVTKDTMIGVDLAKSVFQLHAASMAGQPMFRQKLSRQSFARFMAEQQILAAPQAQRKPHVHAHHKPDHLG
ncbi:MAG: hypothetical protein V4579_13525, partial [Pseudomonadota bacterium]